MSRLRSRSLINPYVLWGCALLAGACGGGSGDDTCGPGNAPASGLVASASGVALTFGALEGGPNNDCPVAGTPAGVTSLTIAGVQTDGTGIITLCVSRPDLLADRGQALGNDGVTAEIRVVDLNGSANNCQLTVDQLQSITGTATTSGMCDNGESNAGFALTVSGTLTLKRTCGQVVDSVSVTLAGTVAVAHGL